MKPTGSYRHPRSRIIAFAAMGLAIVVFWNLRIIEAAQNPHLFYKTIDLYTEHYPMVRYAAETLRSARLPLWNPYQLCGLPFLAVPHTGLLYPGNLAYLLFDPAIAIEITFIAHQVFAAWCMWLLCCAVGLSSAGGIAGAATFVWSGWMINNIHQAAIISGMCWLPATALAIERTLQGRPFAPFGIAVAVAFQILNGATEIFVYNTFACALFALFRSGALVPHLGVWLAAKRMTTVAVFACAGVLLSMPQILPSLELVERAGRAYGSLTLQQAKPFPAIAIDRMLLGTLNPASFSTVGILVFVGVAFGSRQERSRSLWFFAVVIAGLSILLASGGVLYELYFNTAVGRSFRYPAKFLHTFSFGAALLSAIILSRLACWRETSVFGLWSSPSWTVSIALAAAVIYSLARSSSLNYPLLLAFGAVLVFGVLRPSKARLTVVYALLLLQCTTLFLASSNTHVRPISRPRTFDGREPMFSWLRSEAGHDRVYISPRLRLQPGLTVKQGLLRRINVTTDYESLATRRQGLFFDTVSGARLEHSDIIMNKLEKLSSFAGYYLLGQDSNWRLMDLTSTRFYVVARGEEADVLLHEASRSRHDSGVRLRYDEQVRVYETSDYLPRAYFVTTAITADTPDHALVLLQAPDFAPRREVVLESEGTLPLAIRGPSSVQGTATILEAQPERVVIHVETLQPGYLVLTDSFYPGWKATINGRATPVHRANYLFRAVWVDPGLSMVTFTYSPESLFVGLAASGGTLAILLLTAGVVWRRRSSDSGCRDRVQSS